MPVATICRSPGCDELAVDGQSRCAEHAVIRQAEQAARRAGAKRASAAWAHLYATPRWKRERLVLLKAAPLCCECCKIGLVVPAREVDHIMPHRGDVAAFWDRSNWQGLCRACHSRKTAGEVLNVRR